MNSYPYLGKDLFLKGFDKQLVGVKKNETKKVQAVLPSNHPKKELANKKAVFSVSVKEVKALELAEIDETFVRSFGRNCTT